MKKICQLYSPSWYRSYGQNALKKITETLNAIKECFDGIYLIGTWKDGGADNGFDVVEYTINPKFGSDNDLKELIKKAHKLGLEVGVDIVPNHTSDKSEIAQNCINGIQGYEDALYVVDEEQAKVLTEAGVPSFFGQLAYSPFGDKYIRSTFADFRQLNLNWENEKVREYFKEVFSNLREIGVDFCRVDCGMLLFEDVSKAEVGNPFACMNPVKSVEAIREASGGMPLFFEWFDTAAALFEGMDGCYALDCSYVMSCQQNLNWAETSEKLVPLLGGHDQMTIEDRGYNHEEAIEALEESKAPYGFLDIQTVIGWKTDPRVLVLDENYDADLANKNQRYRTRRPIHPILQAYRAFLGNNNV